MWLFNKDRTELVDAHEIWIRMSNDDNWEIRMSNSSGVGNLVYGSYKTEDKAKEDLFNIALYISDREYVHGLQNH